MNKRNLDDGEAAMCVNRERGDGTREDVGAASGAWKVAARVGDRVVAEDALPVRVAHVEVECPATEILALEIVPNRTKIKILNIHEKKSTLLCEQLPQCIC